MEDKLIKTKISFNDVIFLVEYENNNIRIFDTQTNEWDDLGDIYTKELLDIPATRELNGLEQYSQEWKGLPEEQRVYVKLFQKKDSIYEEIHKALVKLKMKEYGGAGMISGIKVRKHVFIDSGIDDILKENNIPPSKLIGDLLKQHLESIGLL